MIFSSAKSMPVLLKKTSMTTVHLFAQVASLIDRDIVKMRLGDSERIDTVGTWILGLTLSPCGFADSLTLSPCATSAMVRPTFAGNSPI